jgi:hypothetical protein
VGHRKYAWAEYHAAELPDVAIVERAVLADFVSLFVEQADRLRSACERTNNPQVLLGLELLLELLLKSADEWMVDG